MKYAIKTAKRFIKDFCSIMAEQGYRRIS